MTLWQSSSWKQLLIESKQAEKVFEIEGVFVEKRSIGFGKFGCFSIGVGKILSPKTLEKIISLCLVEKALFFQVEYIDYSSETPQHQAYYKKFIPPYTVVLDLKKSEETLLSEMKPKGRYNIKLAREKGVVCKKVEKNSENIALFYNLFQETTSRDAFSGNTLAYYTSFLECIKESELIFAFYDGNVIAAGIFVFYKEVALYYYGASANTQRNLMAPYLLQWTAIKEAQERGCAMYDFLGVAGPEEKNSPLSGVTDFKTKFSQKIICVSGSELHIIQKKQYFFFMMVKKLKGLIRK